MVMIKFAIGVDVRSKFAVPCGAVVLFQDRRIYDKRFANEADTVTCMGRDASRRIAFSALTSASLYRHRRMHFPREHRNGDGF